MAAFVQARQRVWHHDNLRGSVAQFRFPEFMHTNSCTPMTIDFGQVWDQLDAMVQALVNRLPDIVTALMSLLIFVVLAQLVGWNATRQEEERDKREYTEESPPLDLPILAVDLLLAALLNASVGPRARCQHGSISPSDAQRFRSLPRLRSDSRMAPSARPAERPTPAPMPGLPRIAPTLVPRTMPSGRLAVIGRMCRARAGPCLGSRC